MATSGFPLWSTTASANASADPAGPFPEGMAPSAVNDGVRGLMASMAKWRDDFYGVTSGLTTGGTSTAYTVTTNSTFADAADMDGVIFTIIPDNTSGAAPTLSVDGLTAQALNYSTGVAIPTAALVAGTPYLVRYTHATTEFIVLGKASKHPLSAVDIIGGTQETAPAADDTLAIYDLSATANRRILVSDFLKIVNVLTADDTPESAADYALTYDASASAVKKVLLDNWPKGAQPPAGSFKNLVIKVTGNTGFTVTADSVTITDGSLFKSVAVNSTVNMGTTGADALDTGTIATNTWYAVWVIAKADGTTKCVASTSGSSPTMPTDYTYKARFGYVQTVNATATLYGTWQFGRRAQYVVGLAQTSSALTMGTGGSGSVSTPTWTSIALARYVPPTASEIFLSIILNQSGAGNGIMVAPNNSYGAISSTTNPPPLGLSNNNSSIVWSESRSGSFLIESSNIYYAATGSSTAVFCNGWVDNI